MTASDQPEAAYLTALRLLTGRDYTRLSLVRKLRQRGFSVEQVQYAADRLSTVGYLQDRRYAERFVTASRESGRFTGIRLRQELQRRGVPAEIAEQALQDGPDAEHEQAQARSLVLRRYPGVELQQADERERRRISGFLQRRGYSSAVICNLLRQNTVYQDE